MLATWNPATCRAFRLRIPKKKFSGAMRFWKKSSTAALQSQPTPNPNSLKFTAPGQTFIDNGLLSFRSAEAAATHPLAAALFAIPGVCDVLILPEFVTVTKRPDVSWDLIEQPVCEVLRAYLAERTAR